MIYNFDVTNREDETIIKVTVGLGSSATSVIRTIRIKNGSVDCEIENSDILSEMIDNIRLTVKEREDAINNANAFKDYIRKQFIVDFCPKVKMITEKNDINGINNIIDNI